MKKIYALIFLSLILYVTNTTATVWTVQVNDNSFSPNTLPNVQCGDTIRWTINSSLFHTTTSTTIPSGATPWNAPVNPSATEFEYQVPNIAGVYNYKCNPHGFIGSFTVSCTAGIDDVQSNNSSTVYPNPFTSSVTLTNHSADAARIIDMTGQVVKTISLNASADVVEINLDAFAPGIYFITTYKEGVIRQSQKIVKAK